MEIHAAVVLSTHYHLLLSPREPDQLVRFVHFVQTNVAKEAGDLHDGTGPFWARRYRHVPVSDETETVTLTPLPCWRGLPEEEVKELLGNLVETIEQENDARRRADGKGVVGVKALRRRPPHERPEKLRRSSAPRFHGATREGWRRLADAYREFAAAFRDAAELLRLGAIDVRFPAGSFPPGRPYVPHQAPG